MDPIGIGSLVVGVIGTALAILVAVRARHLARPYADFGFGTLDDKNTPRRVKRIPKRVLVVGAPSKNTDRVPFVCIFHVHNPTNVALTDVSVRLEYPKRYLFENASFLDKTAQQLLVPRLRHAEGRTITPLGDFVQVRYDSPILRPKETFFLVDILALDTLKVENFVEDGATRHEASILKRRMGDIKGFVGATVIHATVWSGNCKPGAMEATALWLDAETPSRLASIVKQCALALWEGKRPKPGIYLKMPGTKRPQFKRERADTYLTDGRMPRSAEAWEKLVIGQIHTADAEIDFEVPPWRFVGAAYDLFG